jgi:hypothetical protein
MKKHLHVLARLGIIFLLIATIISFSTPVFAKPPVTNGTIAGKVLNAVTGKPISGVWVYVNSTTVGSPGGSCQTQTDGTYSISIPAGNYQAHALPADSGLLYSDQWYNGVTDQTSASTITVKSGATISNIYFRLAPFGTISGYVYDTGGKAIKGATVNLQSDSGPAIIGTFTTGSDGSYYFSGLDGSYVILALAKGFAQQFYKEVPRRKFATSVISDPNVGAAYIDFKLIAGGTISGTVTDQNSGAPIGNISLKIQSISNPVETWVLVTGRDGNYSINLPSDEYVVNAPSGITGPNGSPLAVNDIYYIQEFWQEKTTAQDANAVTIDAKHITNSNINFSLSPLGTISGTVYDRNGIPLSNATVIAINAVDNLDSMVMKTTSTVMTDSEGKYTLYLPHTGPYAVSAVANGYERRWYSDSLYVERNVNIINVEYGFNITSINFELGSGGTISGRVMDSSNSQGLPNVSVWAFASLNPDQNDTPIAAITHTNAQGYYVLDGLSFGVDYAVFSPLSISIGGVRLQSGDGDYVSEYWNEDSTLPYDPAFLQLSSGNANLTGINFTLERGGTISGTVTDANGNPVKYAAVTAFKKDTSRGYWDQYCTGGYTDENGYYRTSGLTRGIYDLRAQYGSNIVWLNGIQVTTGSNTPENNFNLLPLNGTIAGHVYDLNGKPVMKAVVQLFGNNAPPSIKTRIDGSYSFTGLNGSYNVGVFANGYAQQFYDKTSRMVEATLIQAGPSNGRMDIDFYLENGGTISGTIVEQDTNTPLEGISLKIQQVEPTNIFWVSKTNSTGKYSINVPDGTYIVMAPSGLTDANGNPIGPRDADYVQEYWQETASLKEAMSIIIDKDHINNTNINFSLSPSIGTIAGTVHETDGVTPIPGATVTAIFAADNLNAFVMKASSQALTDRNGNYILRLPMAGPYAIAAVADGHERRWYIYSSQDPDQSTPYIEKIGSDHLINIEYESIINSIDFTLGGGGTISGQVTDTSRQGLSGISVWAFADLNQSSSDTPIACITHTDDQGNYTLDGLAFGVNYAVVSPFSISIGANRLQSGDNDYVPEFWQENSTLPHVPDYLSLTLENPMLPDVNFTLEDGGTISGTVTINGAPILYASVTAYLCGDRGYWDQYCTGGYTDDSGYYKTSGLPAGKYVLSVTYYDAAGKHVVWYDNKSSQEVADQISVNVSQDSSGINFVLP